MVVEELDGFIEDALPESGPRIAVGKELFSLHG